MAFNPTWRISLTALANSSYDNTAQKRKAREVSSTAEFKRIFGNSIVEEIIQRTQSGIDKNGKAFPAYSKSYKESLQFQVYGKTNSVDLTLTGEMLASLQARYSGNDLLLDLQGQNNKDKAQGHISGQYGQSSKIKKRDFLGLPENRLKTIYKESIKEVAAIPDAEFSSEVVVNENTGQINTSILDLITG